MSDSTAVPQTSAEWAVFIAETLSYAGKGIKPLAHHLAPVIEEIERLRRECACDSKPTLYALLDLLGAADETEAVKNLCRLQERAERWSSVAALDVTTAEDFRADAELGRLVRQLPQSAALSYEGTHWQVRQYYPGKCGKGDSPEEALRAALGQSGESPVK